MSNATALTISRLVAQAGTATPAGNVFDTGTAAVTVYGTVSAHRGGQLIIDVRNGGTGALTAAVVAGDAPPAFLSALGAVSTTIGAGSAAMIHISELAQVLQNDSTIGLTLTPNGTIAGTVRAYGLP